MTEAGAGPAQVMWRKLVDAGASRRGADHVPRNHPENIGENWGWLLALPV